MTAAFSGTAAQVDPYTATDGPWLYAVAQPSTSACGASYGADVQAVGAAATTLSGSIGTQVSSGSFSNALTYIPGAPGTYTICSWLEDPYGDAAGVNVPANQIFAVGAPLTLTATPTKASPAVGCKVPKLKKNTTLAAAEKALKKDHCKVGKVTKARNHKVKKGRVIKFSAKAGSKHKNGTKIGIQVSKG